MGQWSLWDEHSTSLELAVMRCAQEEQPPVDVSDFSPNMSKAMSFNKSILGQCFPNCWTGPKSRFYLGRHRICIMSKPQKHICDSPFE